MNAASIATRVAAAVLAAAAACGAPAARADELAVCADPANLPYSNEREEGFENRIAALVARELGATLRYAWSPQRRSFLRNTLNAGACDVVVGLPAGLQGVTQTRPYYASTYVFVTRRGEAPPPGGFDDPVLRGKRIGLPAVGGEGANPPPADALARRGMAAQVVGFRVWGEAGDDAPQGRIVDAVARRDIDVAVLWGPLGGYFAQRRGGLDVSPAVDDDAPAAQAFRYEIAMGVRRGDDALRDRLQQVLDRREGEIRQILESFGVPLAAPSAGRHHPTGE